ncbi:hypothetical protein Tco_0698048 [Tanacetum coccineum]
MTVNRLVLEWEEKIKLHLEREMQFNQWRSKNFKGMHPTLIATNEGMDDEGEFTLYLMRRSLEVLRKFHWMILGGRFNQLSHVSSPLLSKPGEYCGKVYNLETATYGKTWDNEDAHDLGFFESEFPAIVFNDTLTSEATLSCEPTVSSLNNDEIDFRISFDESDDEDCTVIFNKNSFSYKIISVNDLKTDLENDNDKVNMPLLPSPEPTVSYFDDLDFFKDFENEFSAIVYNDAQTSKLDDLDYFKDFEKEFPAIVYNDAQTSKLDFLTEPTLSPQHIDEFNLKDETSLSECDEEEQNVLNFNDLFPFNVIYPNELKTDTNNDNDKVDIEHSSGDLSVIPLPDVINFDVGAYAHGSNKLLETKEAKLDPFMCSFPRSKTMDLEQNNSLAKLPLLKQGEYDTWRLRIESYIQLQDYSLWEIIEEGNSFKPVAQTTREADGHSSTNDDNIANVHVSTGSSPVSTNNSTASLSDATIYAYLATQPNGSQVVHEDLEQIHKDDLDEMDLKCFNVISWDTLARELQNPKSRREHKQSHDNSREDMNVKKLSPKAMLAIDGTGFDWSYMLKRGFYQTLHLWLLSGYEPSVEERLVFYKKNESMLNDQIAVFKRDASYKDSDINGLEKQVERIKKEKEGNQFKIDNYENASKSLDQMIGNQLVALAIPGQTATGKESSNPFMAGSLPKTINSNNVDEESQKIGRQAQVMISDAEEYLISEDPVKQGRMEETENA